MNSAAKHILFIDDEVQFLSSISKILELSGYQVTSAASGAAALEVLEKSKYLVALVDRTLPDSSGEELVQTFFEKVPDLPVLMLSGYDSSDMVGNPANVVGSLIKPFRAAELINAINTHCE